MPRGKVFNEDKKEREDGGGSKPRRRSGGKRRSGGGATPSLLKSLLSGIETVQNKFIRILRIGIGLQIITIILIVIWNNVKNPD